MELIDIKSPYRYYYMSHITSRKRAWVTPLTPGTCRNLGGVYGEVEERGLLCLRLKKKA